MQRVLLEPAYVLHSMPYRDTSLIVDLITKQYGRVSVVARSARGPKSRYQGRLQSFVPLLVSYAGRYELKNLNQIELSRKPYDLVGNNMLCGFYLNELLMRLLQKDESCPDVYEEYQKTLSDLERGECVETVLRLFEKNLLFRLGYGLALDNEALTLQPIRSELHYRFLVEQGFVLVEADESDHTVFSGETLLAMHNEKLNTPNVLKEAKRLMRLVLAYYLDGRAIKSRELF